MAHSSDEVCGLDTEHLKCNPPEKSVFACSRAQDCQSFVCKVYFYRRTVASFHSFNLLEHFGLGDTWPSHMLYRFMKPGIVNCSLEWH